MTTFLHNYLSGQWQSGARAVHTLLDPVTGEALAQTGGAAEGLQEGFAFARTEGARALQAMTYGQRAAMLAEVVKLLQSKRDDYYAISLANSGTTKADSGVDVDGGIFTLGYYAKLGAAFGEALPIACDESEIGRQLNRRVEVWLRPSTGSAAP